MSKTKQRALVGLVAVVGLVAAAMLAALGLPYGKGSPEAFAHVYTHPATGIAMHLEMDAVPDVGTPCQSIQTTATVAVGTTHKVDICLDDYTPNAVEAFELVINNDAGLDLAPDPDVAMPHAFPTGEEPANGGTGPDCSATGCLDDNPDANQGAGPNGLGLNWDCTGMTFALPRSETLPIHLVCMARLQPPLGTKELATDPGLLATVTFQAAAAGVDNVTFGPSTAIGMTPPAQSGSCGDDPAALIGCFGATITKVADLGIVKTIVGSTIAGSNATFNLALSSNAGVQPAIAFDDLPNDFTYNDAATDTANGGGNRCGLVTVWPIPVIGDGINVIVCGDTFGVFGAGGPQSAVTAPSALTIIAGIPLADAGMTKVNVGVVGPADPNLANQSSVVLVHVAAANVSITKTLDKANYSEGDSITATVTATSNGPSPASAVLTDTVDANQSITTASVAAPKVCMESGTQVAGIVGQVATCTLAAPLAANDSAVLTVVSLVIHSAGNSCVDNATVTWQGPTPPPPVSATVQATANCLPPTVRMEKDIDLDATSIDNAVNLCLIKNPQGGLQCLTLYELVSNPGNDPKGVGAYEFELKYDHSIFQQPVIENYPTPMQGPSWLSNGGTRSVDCSMSIINENAIWWGCVSSGPVPGQRTAGAAARITVCPQPDLVNRLTPGQQNGIFSPVLDENCELANVLGDPLHLSTGQLAPGILPGGQVAVCSDMGITVRILEGDLNLDGTVNVYDEQAIAYRYGATFGNLLYNSWYDLEPALKDYDIDIKDLQKVWGRQGSLCGINGEGTIPPQNPLPLPDP